VGNGQKHLYEFGPFVLDADERVLLKDGVPVPLTPKTFDTLFALVTNHGHILEKDDLMKQVWPDSFVEEANLTQNISVLRKVLGEGSDQRFIDTVPKRGYRFVAPVREAVDEEETYVIEEHTTSRVVIESLQDGEALATVSPTSQMSARRPVALVGALAAYRRRFVALIAVVLVITALAAAYIWVPGPKKARSIAVLPFKIGGENSNQYMGLGLTDACIRQIGPLKAIRVRPVEDVSKYVSDDRSPAEIGRELGVDIVLAGKIWRREEWVTANVEMWRVDDGSRPWSRTFDTKLTDLLTKGEDSIPERLARELKIKLTPDEKKRLEQGGTESVDAYNLYLSGRTLWSQRSSDPENLRRALAQFSEAETTDPEFALAIAAEAECFAVLGSSGYDSQPRDNLLKAGEKANAAVELDGALPEAHASLGIVDLFYYWNVDNARKQLLQALELNPSSSTARYWYCVYLIAAGKLEEAIDEARKAEESDPSSILMSTSVARALYYARQYDRAIEQCQKTIEKFPEAATAHYIIGSCFQQKGMYPKAIEQFNEYAAGREDSPLLLASLGTIYALEGNKSEATRLLRKLETEPKDVYVSPTYTATIYAALGNFDKAFDLLNMACEREYRASEMLFLRIEPTLSTLQNDPRFEKLAARVRPL
jgi:DNA-binding winged helix-turn-helix (wHTH) protein/tetratricopeptide (TPR) repeat protein